MHSKKRKEPSHATISADTDFVGDGEGGEGMTMLQESRAHNFIDIEGEKFGMLSVTEYHGRNKQRESLWKCLCDCGNITITTGHRIRYGKVKSCGCISHEITAAANTKHGMARNGKRHPIYDIWTNMKDRCYNPNFKQFKDYGGRGITVCEEWQEFIPFMEWATKNGYKRELQIDRIDNSKGYSPSNCRFATRSQNQRNMRRNRHVTINGITKLMIEWCEITGLHFRTISLRIEKGWPDAMLLLPPKNASFEYRKENEALSCALAN